MNITVNIESWGYQTPAEIEDTGVSWKMTFKVTAANGALDYTYVVHEPNLLDAGEWEAMCMGDAGDYDFYQGNGEGLIQITKDGIMEFHSYLSGAGGDVDGIMRVPHALVKTPLTDAVALARERGWLRT